MNNLILKQQSLEWLLSSVTEAMLIADREGTIIAANPRAERVFGYEPGTLVGCKIESLVPERVRHRHADLRSGFTADPKARGMGIGMELYGARRNGEEFPVEVSLSPLQTEDGDSFVLATIYDITRRKQAEAGLQESEARMRAIFETAVDAIVTIDEHGIVDRFNPAAEKMFGYAESEIVGRNVSLLMPSPERERHDEYMASYLSTGKKKIIGIGREVTGMRRNGSVFPMELTVTEMRVGGRLMFTGMVRDISERKEAEARHQRLLQELTSANEELTNFAYVVSHDLKAPLRAIGALADWLSTDYADKFNEEGREHMSLLLSRVHRMGALIDGILQYSRVGRVRETSVPLDLNRVVSEVIDLLAPPANISITVDPSLPTVRMEPVRIQQVFQNLISNAIKYMNKPEGKIHVGCASLQKEWQFSVADNGPGIEERHFERIFQLFQTLAPRDRVESTGVGLSLVKKIVELYRGRVWLESRVGQGSTFFFTLPKSLGAVHDTRSNT
jgi:PAS domain S-box-containing protein